MADLLGQAWSAVWRGVVMYAIVVGILRLTGNRALTQLRAYDLVVTIALGSILASAVVSPSVPIAQGVAAILVVVLLQIGLGWIARRSPRVNRLVTSGVVQVVEEGRRDEARMRSMNLTDEQLQSALRMSGARDLSEVRAVFVEPNGRISVLRDGGQAGGSGGSGGSGGDGGSGGPVDEPEQREGRVRRS